MYTQKLNQPIIASIHQRFSWLMNRIGEAVFRPIEIPKEDEDRLRELSERGTIVYMCQSKSHLLYLYLLYALTWAGLPLPAWVAGLFHWLWQPVWLTWYLLSMLRHGRRMQTQLNWGNKRPSVDDTLVYDMAKNGYSTLVCLAPGRPFFSDGNIPAVNSLFPLIKAQRESNRPIYLVPQLLITTNEPSTRTPTIGSKIFGPTTSPGLIRELWQFIWAGNDAKIRMGQEIDLLKIVHAEHKNLSDNEICLKVLEALNFTFLNEERVTVGPRRERLDDEIAAIMQDHYVQDVIREETAEKNNPKAKRKIEQKIRRYVKEIAARYRIKYLKFVNASANFIEKKLYDDVVFDKEGMKRVASTMRETPLIICTSHKSHLDYLLVSQSFYQNGITPPHIAAGVNLSFWPLGPLFRGCGAFFLRRTFRGNKLYGSVFKAYVKHLLREGFSIEFFIEGGRSRTGKLLMPKMGMLNMVIDAWREGACEDIHFLPISVDYERIAEVSSYARELKGGEKKPENIKGLIRSSKLLQNRFGKVYVNYGKPIRLSTFLEENGGNDIRKKDASIEKLRESNVRLAYRIMLGIGKTATVTPTAIVSLALLVHRKRALSNQHYNRLIDFFYNYFYISKSRFAPMLKKQKEASIKSVLNYLVQQGQVLQETSLRHDKFTIYRITEDARYILDYYKNTAIQQLAGHSIVANAILKNRTDTIDYETVKHSTLFLSRLFKREFFFETSRDFDDNLSDILGIFAVLGMIDVTEDNAIKLKQHYEISWIAAVLDNYLEAYWTVAHAIDELHSFKLWQKEFLTRCLEFARRHFLLGNIYCPEATNKSLVSNAIEWMIKQQHINEDMSSGAGPRRTLTISDDQDTIETLKQELSQYLPANRESRFPSVPPE
jgi:glycerol-3-phosphate O-acyltransferase